jgi:farnesyl diphosphate synthase
MHENASPSPLAGVGAAIGGVVALVACFFFFCRRLRTSQSGRKQGGASHKLAEIPPWLHPSSVPWMSSEPQPPSPRRTASSTTKDDFKRVFEEMRRGILDDLSRQGAAQAAVDHIDRMISYNVPHGKCVRGMLVVQAFRAMTPRATARQLYQAMAAGWVLEWSQAAALVQDDMMDAAPMRRGRPSWYRVDDVGFAAINDGLILENQIFTLLRTHLDGEECYHRLVSFVFDLLYVTERGQLLDCRTPFSDFSLERWEEIARTKTGIYTFYAPLHVALELAGVKDKGAYDRALQFALKLGLYFQAQDDFLDVYGDATAMGKVGTDIENGKCSWMIVEALRRASAEQRALLEENYGVDEPSRVAAVKSAFDELGLRGAFREFEAERTAELLEAAACLDGQLAAVGQQLLQRLFKRAL